MKEVKEPSEESEDEEDFDSGEAVLASVDEGVKVTRREVNLGAARELRRLRKALSRHWLH